MKIHEIAIHQNVLTYMFVFLLIIFGIISFQQLNISLFPNVEYPIITVTTVLPGASPQTVENNITKIIEDRVITISQIKALDSTSTDNVSMVVITFNLEEDADKKLSQVREKLDGILRELPVGTEEPVLEKMDMGATPVLSLTLTSDLPIQQLTELAQKKVKETIQQADGVGIVDLLGEREREIRIWLLADLLERYHLTVEDIIQAFQAEHIDIPGGRLEERQTEFTVTTKGEFQSVRALQNLTIFYQEGAPVLLKHVARVEDGLSEKRSCARYNGKSVIGILVRKQSGTNDTEVALNVRSLLPSIEQFLPAGSSLTVIQDKSTFIENTVHHSINEMIFGCIMAVLITFFFLRDVRSTLIVSTILPSVLIATFTFIKLFNFSINMVTLIALSLSIGILIDDAIVVVENIYRQMEHGKSRIKAAIEGTGQILFSVLAMSASILAVFIPIAFVQGFIGRFLVQLGLTISFAVIISFVFAITLTPMLSSQFLKKPTAFTNPVSKSIQMLLDSIEHLYTIALQWVLKHRWITLISGIVTFLLSVGIIMGVSMELMPNQDRSQFNLYVEAPPGTSLNQMEAYVGFIEENLISNPAVKDVFATIGSDALESIHRSEMTVSLVPAKERTLSQNELATVVRGQLTQAIHEKKYPLQLSIQQEILAGMGDSGDSTGGNTPLMVSITGPDSKILESISKQAIDAWNTIPGIVDVSSSVKAAKPEIQIYPKREEMAHAGCRFASVAQTINALIGNYKIGTFKDKGEQYDIRIQLEGVDRQNRRDLEKLSIRNDHKGLIPMISVVQLVEGAASSKINHTDRQKSVTLTANVENATVGEVMNHAMKSLETICQGYGNEYRLSLGGQSDLLQSATQSIGFAMIIAILMIYIIMGSLFNSFLHPFTILFTIPISFSGAFFALLSMNSALSVMSMIGLVLLIGLVVKNAILLLDFTNQLRVKEHLEARQALSQAGATRLRPILMTTFAMIFGMIPVAIGFGEGSEIRSPMALSIIGGLVTSTILTLIVIPAVYSLFDDFMQIGLFKWVRRWIAKE